MQHNTLFLFSKEEYQIKDNGFFILFVALTKIAQKIMILILNIKMWYLFQKCKNLFKIITF